MELLWTYPPFHILLYDDLAGSNTVFMIFIETEFKSEFTRWYPLKYKVVKRRN